MTETSPLLSITDLSRTVRVKGETKKIIDSISYTFKKGNIYNLIGPSGAGKSSLIRLFNRLDEADSGEILYMGKNIKEIYPPKLRNDISYLSQTPHLFPKTVRDNLRYCDKKIPDNTMSEALEQAALDATFIEKEVEGLSVGEQQRVALARMLLREPEIYLLDEPTSACDPSSSRKIEETIKKLAMEKGKTVIIVSHNTEQALTLQGRALLINKGTLAESGPTGEVINNPQTEAGRNYKNRILA